MDKNYRQIAECGTIFAESFSEIFQDEHFFKVILPSYDQHYLWFVNDDDGHVL